MSSGVYFSPGSGGRGALGLVPPTFGLFWKVPPHFGFLGAPPLPPHFFCAPPLPPHFFVKNRRLRRAFFLVPPHFFSAPPQSGGAVPPHFDFGVPPHLKNPKYTPGVSNRRGGSGKISKTLQEGGHFLIRGGSDESKILQEGGIF